MVIKSYVKKINKIIFFFGINSMFEKILCSLKNKRSEFLFEFNYTKFKALNNNVKLRKIRIDEKTYKNKNK